MQVVLDIDPSLNYEVNKPFRKAFNFFLIPILNLLTSKSRTYLKKTHKSANDIIENATTHKALEVLYGYSTAKIGGTFLQRLFKKIWLSTNNSKAVRNRLKLVERELRQQIKALSLRKKSIKIASIASGSSRAIIDSLESVNFGHNPNLSVVFVDKNLDAISYSKGLASSHKYQEYFRWIHDTAGNFFRNRLMIVTFNIIEMVGLIDYFNDEKAQTIFTYIYEALDDDGVLITANISDNSERPFITNAVGWNMIYRSADEFANILMNAGFKKEKMKIFYEPQRIHCVVVATK